MTFSSPPWPLPVAASNTDSPPKNAPSTAGPNDLRAGASSALIAPRYGDLSAVLPPTLRRASCARVLRPILTRLTTHSAHFRALRKGEQTRTFREIQTPKRDFFSLFSPFIAVKNLLYRLPNPMVPNSHDLR